ncbi:SGNH/GDSL hydrolase family protein [Mucilaginibacter ginsenosidivorans]|uniref:Electron transporter RnfD n=1 Tax=Mucilaginibacter ginsenosidivorans TaxID=398053 RepID=A0A5B8UY17_9SPHI|nr:SGNH/GDSL hydrolase family protein [Mucilaginibacter ginsenosidivorans]QEC64087.1 electron transporter RnfD [Mucilaginibacter ginsenosidivorans]
MKPKFLFLFFISLGSFICHAQTVVIRSHDTHIKYMGRIKMLDEAAELSWSASSAKINFRGTGLKATLKDEHGINYIDVILDGKVTSVLQPDSIRRDYTLASGLPEGNHSIELFKRTEWAMGKTWLYQFSLDKGASILPAPPVKKRKMEFFGNSITCGYADIDSSGRDRGTAPFEDAYFSYATLTAKHFDTEFNLTARSGIGIMVSWDPLIMPEMYNRIDATDSESKWDFSKYTPDLVVINLFQNDKWITKIPQNGQFKARFGDKAPTEEQIIKAYKEFVKTVRDKYPKAKIICALGSMDAVSPDSPWPGYIQKAAEQIGDKNILTHFFPYKNTPGHPSVKEQQAMADDLIAFIEQNIKW